MKIGILGSGDVAKSLASGFLGRGDTVMLGTRDPTKLVDWLSEARGEAHAGSFPDAAEFGEIVVLATLGTATVSVLEAAGPASFGNKIVIDATNPLGHDGAAPHLTIGFDDSLGERVQRALPDARIVKAFNTAGNGTFVRPDVAGGPPTMFIAGDDDGAKRSVAEILHDFGWESADLGGIVASRYLEPMCMAWVAYGRTHGTWTHAFKLLDHSGT